MRFVDWLRDLRHLKKRLFNRNNPELSVLPSWPSKTELAVFYAELSQPAEFADIERYHKLPSRTKDGTRTVPIVYHYRDPEDNTRIVGLVRGWKNPRRKQGLIYEINLTSDFQGNRNGRTLLKAAIHGTDKWMRGNPARIATNLDRELGVVRTVYAISLSLGFRDLAQAVYQLWFGSRDYAAPYEKAVLTFLAASVTLVGVRMFWGTGNIRRFVHRRIFELEHVPTRPVVVMHVLLLLLHALIFFFICDLFGAIRCLMYAAEWSRAQFTLSCVALLLLNGFWLGLLRRKRTDRGPETFWMGNNFAFALLLLAVVTISVRFAQRIDEELLAVASLLLVNSVLDFMKTKDTYVLSGASGGG